MLFVYSLFLKLYYFCIYLFSFTNKKAELWLNGRKELKNRLNGHSLNDCIWFHTSSLGEFEQVSYLIETIKLKFPNEKILVTFFSPSGFEVKRNFKFADEVLYLPFDFKDSIESFIQTIKPKLVFWVRYEFWLNALEKLKRDEIPVILLNGVFRENTSLFYKSYLKKCLSCFSAITVINEVSQLNLKNLGFSSSIMYDTRFSRMRQVAQSPFEDYVIQHFVQSDKVVVCGSIWPNDYKILKSSIQSRSDIRWILVPHEVDAHSLHEVCIQFPSAQKYSQYIESENVNILIIDCIGLLARLYRYADIAYVGGGFNKVVHSLIEPLTYSLPTIIGPNIKKSEEAQDFLNIGFVHQIQTKDEFKEVLDTLLSSNTNEMRKSKEIYFNQRTDSINKILELIKDFVTLGK